MGLQSTPVAKYYGLVTKSRRKHIYSLSVPLTGHVFCVLLLLWVFHQIRNFILHKYILAWIYSCEYLLAVDLVQLVPAQYQDHILFTPVI